MRKFKTTKLSTVLSSSLGVFLVLGLTGCSVESECKRRAKPENFKDCTENPNAYLFTNSSTNGTAVTPMYTGFFGSSSGNYASSYSGG